MYWLRPFHIHYSLRPPGIEANWKKEVVNVNLLRAASNQSHCSLEAQRPNSEWRVSAFGRGVLKVLWIA